MKALLCLTVLLVTQNLRQMSQNAPCYPDLSEYLCSEVTLDDIGGANAEIDRSLSSRRAKDRKDKEKDEKAEVMEAKAENANAPDAKKANDDDGPAASWKRRSCSYILVLMELCGLYHVVPFCAVAKLWNFVTQTLPNQLQNVSDQTSGVPTKWARQHWQSMRDETRVCNQNERFFQFAWLREGKVEKDERSTAIPQ